MATLTDQLPPISALRTQRDGLDQQAYANSLQLQQLQAQLAAATQKNSPTAQRLAAEVKALEASQATTMQRLATARTSLGNAIATLYGQEGPQQLIAQLTDDTPLALLPVRIEARFNAGGRQSELWVRIYPDDVAIYSFEKTLTDQEVTAGTSYWTAIYTAITTGGPNQQSNEQSAWSTLVTLYGSGRAAWVALQTKPTNWSDTFAGITSASQLVFPVFNLTKTQAWSRAPRTNVLPDKFVVMLYTGDTVAAQVTGNLVPDELIVGPDPMDSANSFVTTGNQLNFGPNFDWASDFDKAVAAGMGMRIPITAQQAIDGFDKLLVLGLYLSKDGADSQQALEDLIDNHHYSPQGFSLVPQGASTKNTTADGADFSKSDPFANLSYLVEAGKPLFTATDDCDGRNMANALGIDYAPLQYIGNSNGTDYRQALLMNKALYPGTLGYYAGSLLAPVVDAAAQANLENFFSNYVTGRGPLPAFRVGNQPYGLLLTSDFSAWKWQEREGGFPLPFLNTLYNILKDYQAIWANLLGQLLYTGKPGADPSTVLLNILGLLPGSASFFQRNAYSTDNLYNVDAFQYGGKYFADMQKNFTSKGLGMAWFDSFGYSGTGVPQILRLVYQHFTTTLDPANLVDSVPVSETSPLSNNYLTWLAAVTTTTQLEQQNFGAGVNPPTALLYLMLRKGFLQALHGGSVDWFQANAVDFTETLGAINFHNIRPGGTLTKWEVMKAPLGTAVPAHPQATMAVADYLLGIGNTQPQAAIPNDIKAALTELATKPTASLERCLTEHIDTLTYRLDSWQTALFNIRLQTMRNPVSASGGQGQGRRQGINLGAYGWLENIRPSPRTVVPTSSLPVPLQPADNEPVYQYSDNGGFVHAPSINHASAAAVLRSGYLSHATLGAPDAMSVNLSSDRVRRALLLLEGIQNGQALDALLGYQFERGLHDRAVADNSLLRLNEYIYEFRVQFPIQRNLVQQQGSGAQVTIPAIDVVDGLALANSTLAFPYGTTGDVTTASPAEITAVEAEKNNLSDALDAMKDLLTVESVYQLVMGNYERASATMNALQNGDPPPVLDSIDTPLGSDFGFVNRITLQLANQDPTNPAANPWPPIAMTPRAIMETGMNLWLQSILGNAAAIAAQVSQLDTGGNPINPVNIGLDQLGIQPIDLIYIAGSVLSTGDPRTGQENKTGASELEMRFAYAYRKAKSLDDSVPINIAFLQPQGVSGVQPLGQLLPLLRTLKAMITDSRYLNAQDFEPASQSTPVDPNNPKGYNTAELLARIQVAKTNYEVLITALQAIAITATVTPPGGTTTVYTTLGPTFIALDADKLDFAGIGVDFTDADAALLRDQLIAIANASFSNAFPTVTSPTTDAGKLTLLEQARGICRQMLTADQQATGLITQAAGFSDPAKIATTLISAGKLLLGAEFNILPLFSYNNESDILASDADRTQLLTFATGTTGMLFPADEWMQNAAHTRPRLARWDYVRTLAEALGVALPLRPVQLPYKVSDSWLAVEYPAANSVDQDTLSVVIHGDQAFAAGKLHCGLLIDEWTEHIPTQQEVTGITFNYDRPNSFPPQCVLLVVPPAITGHWSWDGLVNIINDTLLRAKLRAVEPQLLATVDKVETSVLLPAVLSNFTQIDLDLALDYRLNIKAVSEKLPIIAVGAASPTA